MTIEREYGFKWMIRTILTFCSGLKPLINSQNPFQKTETVRKTILLLFLYGLDTISAASSLSHQALTLRLIQFLGKIRN